MARVGERLMLIKEQEEVGLTGPDEVVAGVPFTKDEMRGLHPRGMASDGQAAAAPLLLKEKAPYSTSTAERARGRWGKLDKVYIATFERITGVLGLLFLASGLGVWMFKQHSQHRLALLLLIAAMFLSILHYYSLEDRNVDSSRP